MSVLTTPAEVKNNPSPRDRRGYRKFVLSEGADERVALRAHLDWLLANMDYFARRGPRELQTASLALQRDMAMLGLAPQLQIPDAAELAARFTGPDAAEVAREVAQLHRLNGQCRAYIEKARHLMHNWGYSSGEQPMISPEVERKCAQDALYLLSRAMDILDGKP